MFQVLRKQFIIEPLPNSQGKLRTEIAGLLQYLIGLLSRHAQFFKKNRAWFHLQCQFTFLNVRSCFHNSGHISRYFEFSLGRHEKFNVVHVSGVAA